MKGINNAPDGSEQADERSYSSGDGQPGQVALETGQLLLVGDLHGPLNGNEGAALPPEFGETTLKHRDQRTGFELFGHGRNILQSLRFAKCSHEATALDSRPAQQAPLGENNCPGHQAEQQQDEEDNLGDYTGFAHQVDNLAPDHECKK